MDADDDPPFCYLTTTGRRTGRPHSIEIWFGRTADRPSTLYLLAGGRDASDWVRNLLADPAVVVAIGTRTAPAVRATARVLDDGSEEDALARRLLVARYETPGTGELGGWGRTSLAVAVDLSVD